MVYVVHNLQFLTKAVEPFLKKYGCEEMVANEKHKRCSLPCAVFLYRYTAKEIYCLSLSKKELVIEIYKSDSADIESYWNEFVAIPLDSRRYFGTIVVNNELFVIGGLDAFGKPLNI